MRQLSLVILISNRATEKEILDVEKAKEELIKQNGFKEEGFIKLITLHYSLDYEDYVELVDDTQRIASTSIFLDNLIGESILDRILYYNSTNIRSPIFVTNTVNAYVGKAGEVEERGSGLYFFRENSIAQIVDIVKKDIKLRNAMIATVMGKIIRVGNSATIFYNI